MHLGEEKGDGSAYDGAYLPAKLQATIGAGLKAAFSFERRSFGQPVTAAEQARILGRVLRRPALLPVPAAALALLYGQMGRELLLAGAHVLPKRALASGFEFLHPDLESALRAELGRWS